MAGDLGDVLIREGDLVAAVAGTDEVAELLGILQTCLLADFRHCGNSTLLGVDLAADGGIGNDLAGLVKYYCLCVGGAYVAAAEIFHFSFLQFISFRVAN